MKSDETYQSRFANSQRNSFFYVATKAKGEVIWKQSCDAGTHPLGVTLFAWGEIIIASTVTHIHAWSEKGDVLWSIEKRFCSPVVIAEGLLWYQHPSRFLDAVDKEGKVIKDKLNFPGALGESGNVELLYPRKDDFIASTYDLNQRDHDRATGEDQSSAPEIGVYRNVYGKGYFDLYRDFIRFVEAPPLYTPESSVVSLVAFKKVILIDIEEKNKDKEFLLPCKELIEWSILQNGNYCFIGNEGDEKIVTEVTTDGTLVWRYRATGEEEKWLYHPPVSGVNDCVYVLTDHRVLALRKGELLWEYVFPETSEHGYACALSDGTVLVTHGAALTHFSKEGAILFTITLDSKINGQPVVCGNGSIIVATNNEIICIN